MSRFVSVIFLSLCAFISSVTLSTASPLVQTRSSAPRISSAQLGTGATPEYKIIGEASSFSQDIPEIVAVGFVDGVNTGSVLKGLWIAEDTGDVASPNYQIAAKELKLSGGGEPFTVSLSKPNNGWPTGTYRVELYIDGTLAKVLPFTITGKAAAVTEPQASKEESILGLWKGEMGQVEFRKDGALIFNGQPYRYAIQGDTLLVSSDEGSMSIPFQLNGDTLTAVVEGSKTTFKRSGSNQATPPGADAGGGNPPN
jgi:hypothetical protein